MGVGKRVQQKEHAFSMALTLLKTVYARPHWCPNHGMTEHAHLYERLSNGELPSPRFDQQARLRGNYLWANPTNLPWTSGLLPPRFGGV